MYLSVDDPTIREEHAETVKAILDQGLVYPVTVIDGAPIYDGAVSYPAILRAVDGLLPRQEA